MTSPVRVGSGDRREVGAVLAVVTTATSSARCEPATARSWPERESAPVTEMPTVMLQQS